MSQIVVPGASVEKRSPRTEQILAAATRLFGEQGFQAVSIDELGQAAGITGPAVYRHFRSKDDVLLTILGQATERLLAAAERITEAGTSPESVLEELVHFHTGFVLDEPNLVAVYFREITMIDRSLSRDLRRQLRLYIAHWVAVLGELCEGVPEEHLQLTVNGVLSLINSGARVRRGGERARIEPLIGSIALAALHGCTLQGRENEEVAADRDHQLTAARWPGRSSSAKRS